MRRLLLLFFILFNLTVKADYQWTENCLSAYNYASKLNFKQSRLLLADEKLANPNNLIPIYIESQINFLESFINEQNSDLEKLKTNNEIRIKILEENEIKSPYKKLCIAEMYLQKALARVKFEEYIGCIYDVRKAYILLSENQKEFPEFKPNLRGLGLIHSLVGAIPKNYSWVTSLLGLSGTIAQGLGELNLLLTSTNQQPELTYLRDETIVMLTFLEMNLGKDRNDLKIRNRLSNLNELNEKPLLQFAKSVFHASNGENDSVISILADRKKNSESSNLSYLDFMEGTALLNNLNLSAINNFKKYIETFKGKSYINSAWQRVAWIKLLQGDKEGYLLNMSNCNLSNRGKSIVDEDKQALNDSKGTEIPNIILLRSRLLFDGGYYSKSLQELAGKTITNFPSQKDQLEFSYRLARIFDKQNNFDKALYLYEQTLKNGINYTYYFAANSALLIGKIYEDQHNKLKAVEYYKKVLTLRNHEYQNSIDQKAKSGLNRLGL